MQPNDPRRPTPIVPARSYVRPPADHIRPAASDAAAGIVRGQIEHIYQKDAQAAALGTTTSPLNQDTEAPTSPYERTHVPDRTELQAEQWKRYHTAWQDYYQQYYERYYLGEVYRMRQTLGSKTQQPNEGQPRQSPAASEASHDEASESHALYHSLRSDLLHSVRTSTTKVRKSQHFAPLIAAGLTVVLFLFLQYNRVLFANVEAYVSPGSINPANIIVDPTLSVPISKDPKLIIPKINVEVPVVYNTQPDQASQLAAMQNGVAWFGIPGANSRPGQIGNTVLSGHSSNDVFDPGDFKFIFARLEQITEGDTFYINYLGTRYTYSVTKKQVVRPTDVQALVYKTDKPIVTLITCVPVGTSRDRLLVTAEQISPNPAEAKEAPRATEDSSEPGAMPGNSKTLLGRLFSN